MKTRKLFLTIIGILTISAFIAACAPVAAPAVEEKPAAVVEEAAAAPVVAATEPAKPTEFDYSSLAKWTVDPDFPDGGYFFREIKNAGIWGDIPVPDREVKIGYIVKSLDNSFWQAIKTGVEEEAKALKDAGYNVTIDVVGAQGESDTQGQLALMQDMVNKKYDVIIFNPISDANMVPAIEEAQKAGIPIITGNQQFTTDPKVPYFFGVSEFYSGTVAANYIIEALGPEGGEISIVSGIANNNAARARTSSFEAAIAAANNPNLKIVDVQNADWDRGKAKDVVDTQLKKYPNIKAVYANNDTMAMGALEAVRGVGKVGEILVAGIDATDEALESIKKGELTFSVAAFPELYGKIPLEMAFRLLAGQNVPPIVLGEYVVVDMKNANTTSKDTWGWTEFKYTK